jgi:hypothetical protein
MIEHEYYGIVIQHWPKDDLEEETYRYALCGWVYEVETLEEAKKDIKENWTQDRTFWKNF